MAEIMLPNRSRDEHSFEFIKKHHTLDEYFKEDFIPNKRNPKDYYNKYQDYQTHENKANYRSKSSIPDRDTLDHLGWNYTRDHRIKERAGEKLRK